MDPSVADTTSNPVADATSVNITTSAGQPEASSANVEPAVVKEAPKPIVFTRDMENKWDDMTTKSLLFHAQMRFASNRENSMEGIVNNVAMTDPSKEDETKYRILEMADGTRPILHGSLFSFINAFLDFKIKHGIEEEKAFYSKHFGDSSNPEARVRKYVCRLMTQRPIVFFMSVDDYTLRNGTNGTGGWEDVAKKPYSEHGVCIENVMTYDEVAIAALVSMSVPTYFINSGSRHNFAQRARSDDFQRTGIYTGCVGARLEKPDVMEWQFMVLTPYQNTTEKGYGRKAPDSPQRTLLRMWARLFGQEYFLTYDEAKELQQTNPEAFNETYEELFYPRNHIFNKKAFSARIRLTIEAYLRDADDRAKATNQKAHCVVVGLGLGVWKLADCQTRLMLNVYDEILQSVRFENIDEITFSWFDVQDCGGVRNGGQYTNNGNNIRINFNRNDPAAKLRDPNQLLVAQYAWDGNSFPGNEYWRKMLNASGDPAAACCSLISELQNPIVNVNAFTSSRVTFLGDITHGDYEIPPPPVEPEAEAPAPEAAAVDAPESSSEVVPELAPSSEPVVSMEVADSSVENA